MLTCPRANLINIPFEEITVQLFIKSFPTGHCILDPQMLREYNEKKIMMLFFGRLDVGQEETYPFQIVMPQIAYQPLNISKLLDKKDYK